MPGQYLWSPGICFSRPGESTESGSEEHDDSVSSSNPYSSSSHSDSSGLYSRSSYLEVNSSSYSSSSDSETSSCGLSESSCEGGPAGSDIEVGRSQEWSLKPPWIIQSNVQIRIRRVSSRVRLGLPATSGLVSTGTVMVSG